MTTLKFEKVKAYTNKTKTADAANVGYGVFDAKKREIGDFIVIIPDPFLKYEYVLDENGEKIFSNGSYGAAKTIDIYSVGKFKATAYTTRNGVTYGSAETTIGLFDSYEEAVAAIQAFIPKRIAKLKKKFDKAA